MMVAVRKSPVRAETHSTEGTRVVVLAAAHGAAPADVGPGRRDLAAVAAVQVRIEAIDSSSQFGEVWVSGSHVNPGYVDNPEAEAAHKVHEGDIIWHRTGDVGRLDEDGQLWLVGRVGESVAGLWPLAVEGEAEAQPWVRQAGLIAIDDRPVAQFLSRNLKPADDGHGFEWQINVAAIAANINDIIGFPETQINQAYNAPTLFLLGGASNHVQSFHMGEIERLFPNAMTEIISDAGHWLHVEKPTEVTTALRVFLDR